MHKNLVKLDAAAGTIAIFKAYHIVKDVPLPTASTLKIVSGQKIVLNANDKLYAYASAGTVDVIADITRGNIMSYIGVSIENKVAPNFVKEDFGWWF